MREQIFIEQGGHRLCAWVDGDPRSPAIVLVHGWPLTKVIWCPVIEPLAREHFVIAFDLPSPIFPGLAGQARMIHPR